MVTTYKDCGINHDSTHNPQDTDPYFYVSIGFASTTKITPIIPLIYDRETYADPYSYHFTIQGELSEIKSIDAYFILKGVLLEKIPIDAELLNKKRTKENRKDHYYFPAGGNDLPFSWSQIDDLEMDIHFTAVDLKGNTIEHSERKQFKKYIHKETGNRIIVHAMSL
jgi:hypothetical protein